jgi:hypothetical protein
MVESINESTNPFSDICDAVALVLSLIPQVHELLVGSLYLDWTRA